MGGRWELPAGYRDTTALLFTAVAFQARLGMVGAPGTHVEALTAGTLEGPILPAPRMDGGLTRVGVEEVVEMRHHRHGGVSPWITRSVKNRIGDAQLTMKFLDRYKPLEIERIVKVSVRGVPTDRANSLEEGLETQ